MCTMAAKYFYDIGWCAVKNRDRNYIPDVTFKLGKTNGMDRLLFYDEMTDYQEGFNSMGVSILSTSLMVIDDEEVIASPNQGGAGDGAKIKEALAEKNPEKAAQAVIDLELTGHTFVFDQDRLFAVEAYLDTETNKYYYDMEEIKRSQTIARTNHGIWLEKAGYQLGIDKNQDLSRKSSESRMKQAEAVLKRAKTPQDIIDGMCGQPNKNTQMNVLRTTTDRKMMRTTAQEMIIPIESTFFLRPVQTKMEIDFWRLNQLKQDMWVEILSNRSLSAPPHEGMD